MGGGGGGVYLQDSMVLLFNGNIQVSVHGVHVCALESSSYMQDYTVAPPIIHVHV